MSKVRRVRKKVKKAAEKMKHGKIIKLKTKRAAAKRFKLSGNLNVIATQAGKRHNMRKRSNAQLREQRGTTVLCTPEANRIKRWYLRYSSGRKKADLRNRRMVPDLSLMKGARVLEGALSWGMWVLIIN